MVRLCNAIDVIPGLQHVYPVYLLIQYHISDYISAWGSRSSVLNYTGKNLQWIKCLLASSLGLENYLNPFLFCKFWEKKMKMKKLKCGLSHYFYISKLAYKATRFLLAFQFIFCLASSLWLLLLFLPQSSWLSTIGLPLSAFLWSVLLPFLPFSKSLFFRKDHLNSARHHM